MLNTNMCKQLQENLGEPDQVYSTEVSYFVGEGDDVVFYNTVIRSLNKNEYTDGYGE